MEYYSKNLIGYDISKSWRGMMKIGFVLFLLTGFSTILSMIFLILTVMKKRYMWIGVVTTMGIGILSALGLIIYVIGTDVWQSLNWFAFLSAKIPSV